MTQTTAQIPTTNTYTTIAYNTPSQIHIDERRGRYLGTSRQQPDQISQLTPHRGSQVNTRVDPNIQEVNQGLRGLHERIDNILKRSTSTGAMKAHNNNAATIKPSVPKPTVQNENYVEFTQRAAVESRTLTSPTSYSQTAKYVPQNLPSPSLVSLQSPQASSRFYLGGMNSHAVRTDVTQELLHSIKSYQVKTLRDLNATTGHLAPHNYSQEISQNRSAVPLQSTSLLLNSSINPFEGAQSGYDRDRLELVISKISGSQQSFSGARPESFLSYSKLSDVTLQDSMLSSKVYEPRIIQEYPNLSCFSNVDRHKVRAPQHLRPAKKTQSGKQNSNYVDMEKKHVVKQNKKTSCVVDELEADGDSMILQFIKEKDELELLDDDEEDIVRKVKEVEEDELFVKKVPKRQEILSSKRQVRREADRPQKSKKYSSVRNAGPQKNTSRY